MRLARAVAAVSVLLLVPVFWHARIQAGDLASHIYNAWLAQLIGRGEAPGLELARPTTNVLFDLILETLLKQFGPDMAQRLAVSLAVLTFFWGAFGFVCVASRSRPWFLAAPLAMLAYGWTFHMGLFNFYLSSGLSLAALALAWEGSWGRRLAAVPLLAVAWVGHAMPVAWSVAVLAYAFFAERLTVRQRFILLAAGAAAIGALRLVLEARYKTVWVSLQVMGAAAVDQVWVFGFKYYILAVMLGICWSFLLLRLSVKVGFRGLAAQVPVQAALLTALGVVLIPTSIQFGDYRMALSLIAERMTLLMGVMACAAFAGAHPPPWQKAALGIVAAAFFFFLYVDTRALARIETRMQASVDALPRGSRIVSSFYDPGSRVFVLAHTLDRVCVGKCFSYGNYEPSSAAFRVRVRAPNAMVVETAEDAAAIDAGEYIVKPRDLPLHEIALCGTSVETGLCTRSLAAGDVVKRVIAVFVTPKLW